MAIERYICRCGNRTNNLTSYFIQGIRVTVCELCERELKNTKDAIPVDYEDVKKEPSMNEIDTTEK